MHFTEVAFQNVRAFSPQGRFALKQGFLVLKPPGGEMSPLAALSLALLYADGRGDEAKFSANQKAGKLAFTFVGQDNITYRLLRELGGVGTLHKQTAPGQPPELVSQDTAEIGQFLRAQVGLPSRSAWEHLYSLVPGQMPSRRPRARASNPNLKRPSLPGVGGSHPGMPALASNPSMPALASTQAVSPAEDVPAAEARVKELEQEIVKSREMEELQFKLDGLNSSLFEVERKLKSTEGLKVAVRDAENAWNAAPTPQSLGLPDDILARVERYPKVVAKKEDALNRLAQERELEAQMAPVAVEPLKKNIIFWIGAVAGVLFLLLGIILGAALDSGWRYLTLLDIPAFGWAAMVALRYVDDLSNTTNVRSKEGMFSAREKKVLEEFDAESSPIRKALKALDVETPEEIPAMFERKGLMEQRLNELRDQLTAMENDPEYLAAGQHRDSIKEQIEEMNAAIGKKGSFVRDLREVERDLSRTKESIVLAKAGGVPAAAGGMDPGAAAAASGPMEDPSPMIMKAAADLLSMDVAPLAGLLRDRCTQYLSALTDRRYLGVEWDKDGQASVYVPGQQLAVGEIPPRDMDMYYLALRMTVVEKVSVKVKYPFILEHPFVGMDEVKLPLLGKMLKHLGTLTQVLLVTNHPGLAQLAESTVNV